MDDKLIRTDLILLVQRLVEMDYANEEECDLLITQLQRHPRSSKILEYVFEPDRPMTPEEIVDSALSYQPIIASYSLD